MAGRSDKDRNFDLAVRDADHRADRLKVIARVVYILATAVPFWVIRVMVSDLAGEDTRVSLNLVAQVGVSASVTLAGVDGFLIWKTRQQRAELVRLRQEKEVLEARLLERNGGGPA